MTKINELLSRVVRLTRAATPTGCWPARTADNDRNERRLIKGDVERTCPWRGARAGIFEPTNNLISADVAL
ncbi:MAG: hypothetical protein WBF75_24670 [Pseudonocardiaceae bacterium]